MKGNIKVVVSTKKLRYELNLRRNITIIQGDSATGKTTLIQIINDYLSGRTGPGTDVICKKKCAVLSGDLESVLIRLERLSDTIVFADEQEHFLYSKRFAAAVLKSDCYFVFITRDDLHTLPYSVNEIYCLKIAVIIKIHGKYTILCIRFIRNLPRRNTSKNSELSKRIY